MVARKTTKIASCDRDGCKNWAEIVDDTEAPDGWLLVYTEENNKYVNRALAFEFCSEKCVGIWAGKRKQAISASGNGNGHNNNKSVVELVKEAVEMFDGGFTRNNISEILPELNSSQISSALQGLKDRGIVEVVDRDSTGSGAPANVYSMVRG